MFPAVLLRVRLAFRLSTTGAFSLGKGKRTNRNVRFAQRPRHRRGNRRRAGSVAMNAKGLRVYGNFAAVARDDYPSLCNA